MGHTHDARGWVAAVVATALSALWLLAAGAPASAATGQPTLDAVGAVVTRTSPPSPPVLETVQATTEPVVATVQGAASSAVADASQTTASVVKTVETTTAPAVDTARRTVAPVVDAARRAVAPAVDHVVAPAVGQVDKVVSPVVGHVDRLVTPVVHDDAGERRTPPVAPGPSAAGDAPAAAGVEAVAAHRQTTSSGAARIERREMATRSLDGSPASARPAFASTSAPAPAGNVAALALHPAAATPGSTAAMRARTTPAPTAPQGPGGPARTPVGASAGAGSSSAALALAALGALVALTAWAAARATRRLRLAAARWRPAAFLSLLERPG